ncbi:hypothetical protein JTB14_028172 [Gonioctena quinquepunctata]|nr:hypothetical protein JTB14_028172 [Gonioctena quinquepunctata]
MDTKPIHCEKTRILELCLERNNKTEDELKEDIHIIREWVKNQPHLPEVPSDRVITNFLLLNKFSIENTKQRLDMYYTMRSLFPDFFQDKHPLSSHMLKTMDLMYFLPLPEATEGGYRVVVLYVADDDPTKFDGYNYLAHTHNVYEQRLHKDYLTGDIFIFDLSRIKMGHISQFTPIALKKISTTLEKTYSNQVKQIHVVNYPSFAEPLIAMVRRILNPKIAQRFHFHQDIHSIRDSIPSYILPKDYGGEELSLAELNEIWKEMFANCREKFDDRDRLRVKEELRPTPLVNDEVLGFHGNFKKLNVD